jgi:hypothetical protein
MNVTANLSRQKILGIYRECLSLAKRFPSVKRDALVQDIRAGV